MRMMRKMPMMRRMPMMREHLVETGIVLEWDPTRGAKVQLGADASCEGCPAESICKGGDEDRNFLWVPSDEQVEVGRTVRIQIEGADLLKSSFMTFGLPLFLFVVGALIADLLLSPGKYHDLWVCLIGLACLSAGLFYTASWQKMQEKDHPNFRAKLVP
jgi:positive regulator of sigma E activity